MKLNYMNIVLNMYFAQLEHYLNSVLTTDVYISAA